MTSNTLHAGVSVKGSVAEHPFASTMRTVNVREVVLSGVPLMRPAAESDKPADNWLGATRLHVTAPVALLTVSCWL